MKTVNQWVMTLGVVGALNLAAFAAAPTLVPAVVEKEFNTEALPLLKRYCHGCHSTEAPKGDLDLERFQSAASAAQETKIWEKALEMLETGEMPPKEKRQPSESERHQLEGWVRGLLDAVGRARAGDPGRVVMRRLSNVEYTLSVRDLTGVALDPARDFPIDGAAGEGFVNTGEALVMSPSLLDKYLAAAKDIANHAVLLPDGLGFSRESRRGEWIDERLKGIRDFYARYTDAAGGTRINLQGIALDTNTGGRLPIERYLAATLEERRAIAADARVLPAIARERGLHPKYLAGLWQMLTSESPASSRSLLWDQLRDRWRRAGPADSTNLALEIGQWQTALTRFQTVGHMKPWMVEVDPATPRQAFRLKLPASTPSQGLTVFLMAGDAGDGAAEDIVVWEQPRLAMPGRPDILLRDVRGLTRKLEVQRERLLATAAQCLAAASAADGANPAPDREALAKLHRVDAELLGNWFDFLGISNEGPPSLEYFTNRLTQVSGYDFVQGWGSNDTPLLAANRSDQPVRIPGNLRPHSVAVHPSPTRNAVVGWRSPASTSVRIEGSVNPAHPECGNGVIWNLELRRAATRRRLAGGIAQGGQPIPIGPVEKVRVRPGDLLALVIGPRDGNHACDLTDVELTLAPLEGEPWRLTSDVSSDVLANNPHADRFGNAEVWHFFVEAVMPGGESISAISPGSLLDRWQSAESLTERQELADELQRWLAAGPPTPADGPDAVLFRQLTSLGGPLLGGARARSPGSMVATRSVSASGSEQTPEARSITHQEGHAVDGGEGGKGGEPEWGPDPSLFGRLPTGEPMDVASLGVQAPSVIEVRLPMDLVQGRELVTTAMLHPRWGKEGSVQAQVGTNRVAFHAGLQPGVPILVSEGGRKAQQLKTAFAAFREWFPAALCYTKIVPVDEVITLTVFHREDQPLCRLMLDDSEKARLDRMWSELHYIGQDALTMVDAYAQLMEYATQDSDPKLFSHLGPLIEERAATFRRLLLESEPRHLEAVLALAERAYRRPLASAETEAMRQLYRGFREQGLFHDEAVRLTLTRVLVAPSFLYRTERPAPGDEAQPVNDWELASRLSYFLWSSLPDDALRSEAAAGRLHDPEVALSEAARLREDPRVRALATEFACQWLHIRDFDSFDEKSERQFPTFAALRKDMYEESVRFFVDLFQRDGSVLEILNADHTFLNGSLAEHYGIAGVTGSEWRRVDDIQRQGRGGVLGMATMLAKQSGASRTSPILRGNWVVEALLGEKLPKPPKGVPQLPENETDTGEFTVREITERHTRSPECAGCHVRIDPFGFALESYDAIGRRRHQDLAGRDINTRTRLTWKDDAAFEDLDGLRRYLLERRREDFLRTFCRKLLGYSLGRGLQLSDHPLVEEMLEQLHRQDYRFSAAVDTIIRSRQFRYQRGLEATQEDRL